eukprot:9236131-Alexandrium_andersonii.AAC.1
MEIGPDELADAPGFAGQPRKGEDALLDERLEADFCAAIGVLIHIAEDAPRASASPRNSPRARARARQVRLPAPPPLGSLPAGDQGR